MTKKSASTQYFYNATRTEYIALKTVQHFTEDATSYEFIVTNGKSENSFPTLSGALQAMAHVTETWVHPQPVAA